MAVSHHLGIPLREYDARIRTFIPWYEEMLAAAAASLPAHKGADPTLIDIGIGSGALASACLSRWPRARVTGVDADAEILQMAAARLGRRLTTLVGDFETAVLPKCDAVVSAYALHHVPTARRKAALVRRIHRALKRGGTFVIADCLLAERADLAASDHEAWLRHLREHYSAAQSRAYLRAWSFEDHYFTLNDELTLLRSAGFRADVRWRRHSFAVIAATRT